MPKPKSQSLLWPIAAALAARGAIIIEDFSGPVDAFFLDDGSAAGLPSSGNSALEKVDDGLRLNYDVTRNGPFGAALLGKVWGGYRDLSNASSIRLTYRVEGSSRRLHGAVFRFTWCGVFGARRLRDARDVAAAPRVRYPYD